MSFVFLFIPTDAVRAASVRDLVHSSNKFEYFIACLFGCSSIPEITCFRSLDSAQ